MRSDHRLEAYPRLTLRRNPSIAWRRRVKGDNPIFMRLSRLTFIIASSCGHRPNNPCVLVCQGDSGLVEAASFDQALEPQTQGIAFIATVFQDSSCPVNQQGPQRPITALADAQQHLFVATAVLPGHHTHSGRVIATRRIALAVARIRSRQDSRQRPMPGRASKHRAKVFSRHTAVISRSRALIASSKAFRA